MTAVVSSHLFLVFRPPIVEGLDLFMLNIYCYYGPGVQVCDRRPSVRRVLRPTMKTHYDKIRLQNGVSVASARAI
jgi:hypothetical protein